MKAKKTGIAILLCLLTVAMAVLTSFAIFAEEDEPSVSIDRFNLSFNETIYIKYAVSFNGVDVTKLEAQNRGMLFWTSPQESYTRENAESVTNELFYDSTISSYLYSYTKLAAKQMTDVIYSRAYVVVDGETYYSEIEEYSILRYAYNKLGKSIGSTASTNQKLKDLLSSMLDYGAAAQSYFNYKTDRPANADFVDVNVEGGVIAETGMTSGLFIAGDKITLSAPQTNADGYEFSHWTNSAGEIVSEDVIYEATIVDSNQTYTAVQKIVPTGELEYTLANKNGFEYYIVSGIGTYTGEDIVIPETYQDKPIRQIAAKAFAGEKQIKSVYVPSTVYNIGEYAFSGCTNLHSADIRVTDVARADVSGYSAGTVENVSSYYSGYGYAIFYGCSALENLYICDTQIYKTVNNYSVYFPIGYWFGCSSYTGSVASNMGYFDYTWAETRNMYYYFPETLKTITVGNFGIEGTQISPFRNAPVENVIVDASYIPDFALSSSNAKTVTLSENVFRIGAGIFSSCTSLESVNVDKGNSTYYSEENCVIETATKTLVAGCATSVIPDYVTSIGDRAFSGCTNLTSITIPDSVTSIGGLAFYYCTSLTSINYGGSIAEWKAISKTNGWDYNTGDYTVYCTDGNISK